MTARCGVCHQPIAKRNGYWTHLATGHRFGQKPQRHLATPDATAPAESLNRTTTGD